MSANTVVIQGMVRSDGTLGLEGKVPLPAGRVSVTVQPLADSQVAAAFLQSLREIQGIRERDGVKADADAALAAAQKVRDELNEQVEELGRLQEECRLLSGSREMSLSGSHKLTNVQIAQDDRQEKQGENAEGA
jgi:hypothetical protein